MRNKLLALAAAFFVSSASAAPIPVDLSGWVAQEGNGSGAASWNVQGTLSDSVFQTQNSRPSVFFDPTANSQGQALACNITVETSSDYDFIGFVLGFNNNEFDSAAADFWLIDWKQGNQGVASVGLALSHVTGNVNAAPENDFWQHTGTVNEVQRATNLGSVGWLDNTTYNFELIFTSSLIEVKVNGVTELSYSGSFTDGSFGFYNYSQSNVRYAGITEDVAPPPSVSSPATALLFVGGLTMLAYRRKKN